MDLSEEFEQLCVLAENASCGLELEPFLVRIRDVNDVDEQGRSPLWYAATENPHVSVVETLLSAGASVDYEMLCEAVIHNENDEVPIRLYREIAMPSQEHLNRLFLLAVASDYEEGSLVSFFLDQGADIHATLPMDLYPASVEEDFTEEELLWDGSKPVLQEAMVVAIYEHPKPAHMIRRLAALGVDPNAVDSEGYPVIIHALDNCEIIEALISVGANINACDTGGMTPLMHACASEYNEAALMLIQYGADVCAHSRRGETALHHALDCHFRDNWEVVQALIEAGCDVNEPNGEGLTPLALAISTYASKRILDLLEKAGAVIDGIS